LPAIPDEPDYAFLIYFSSGFGMLPPQSKHALLYSLFFSPYIKKTVLFPIALKNISFLCFKIL
jgi:hypothetical protein